jgi:hypothetical protein
LRRRRAKMAVRSQELGREVYLPSPGKVVRFPTARVKARAAAQRRVEIRRRRVAVAVLPLLVMGFVLATGPGGTSVASRRDAPASVVLDPGETIWDLGTRYAPASVDTRAYVDAVLELNDISGAPAAGERIKLPG